MAKKITISLFFVLAALSCTGQKQKEPFVPKTDIKVTKEYDKHGNLIRLDSTYTYFYSSTIHDTLFSDVYENEFKSKFYNQFKSIDSLFKKDYFLKNYFQHDLFLDENYFEDNFYNNQQEIEKVMKRLDSLRHYYFKQNEKMKNTNKKL